MQSVAADKVERWPLDCLIPHARNSRTHSDEQVAQIAGSIAEFGFVNPVLVGDDGVIVAGHGRILASAKGAHCRHLQCVPVRMLRSPSMTIGRSSATLATSLITAR